MKPDYDKWIADLEKTAGDCAGGAMSAGDCDSTTKWLDAMNKALDLISDVKGMKFTDGAQAPQ